MPKKIQTPAELRQRREAAGVSLRELEEVFREKDETGRGISLATLSRYETNGDELPDKLLVFWGSCLDDLIAEKTR